MISAFARSLCIAALLLFVGTASAQELNDYRAFRLGSSLADVSSVTGTTPSDLHVIHERPALLQELAWRPRYAAGTPFPNLDPVREMVFSFYNDQLFTIAIEYDDTRTAGLTREDLVAALSDDYGPPTRLAPGRARSDARAFADYGSVAMVAEWLRGQTKVTLSQSARGSAFTLSIVDARLEALARTARTAAVVIETREAPAREAARLRKQQEDARDAEERARATNKGAFRP